MTTAKDILVRAREILSEEHRWCKGVFAEDGSGVEVGVNSCAALQFCSLGAVMRASSEGQACAVVRCWEQEDGAIKALARELPEDAIGGVATYNDDDETTHADILALFDRAIGSLS